MINVTIWNEYRHEKTDKDANRLYPGGIHAFIADFLKTDDELKITLAALDDEYQGLPDEVLNNTDVLLWWGHMAHHLVSDELVEKIRQRVYRGMGLVVLHSGHHSKVFKNVLGTTGNLSWGDNCKEIVWNTNPTHPIAKGIPDHFNLDSEELYSEPFYIPEPESVVFTSWYETGNIFRSGCCFVRGLGKIFYFQPGHETCSSFYNPYVQKIISNAIRWAKPQDVNFEVPEGCPYISKQTISEFGN